MTPTVRNHYRLGVPFAGEYTVAINSDDEKYGGTGNYPITTLSSSPSEWNGRPNHVELTLPPLATVIFTFNKEQVAKKPAVKKATKASAKKPARKAS